MKNNSIRLNITLPQALVGSLDEVAGNRRRSRFIAEAVQEKIQRIRLEKMAADLKEGYRTHRDESIAIANDFDGAALQENSSFGNS